MHIREMVLKSKVVGEYQILDSSIHGRQEAHHGDINIRTAVRPQSFASELLGIPIKKAMPGAPPQS